MSGLSAGWRRVLRIWRRDAESDIDAELRFHLDQRATDLQRRGVSPEAARAQALAEFGDLDNTQRDLAEIGARMAAQHRRAEWWESIAQDARYIARGLLRSPGFTAMVAATLALGIGANAVIFSLLDRLLDRDPPGVSAPEQVYRLQQRCKPPRCDAGGRFGYSYLELRDVRTALPSSVRLAGYVVDKARLGDDDGAPPVMIGYVEGDFLGILGVRPAAGRFFSPDEARIQNVTPLAVISHRLSTERFGGAERALGQDIIVATHRFVVIGVAQPAFTGVDLDAVDVWAPASTMRPVDPDAPWYEGPAGSRRLLGIVTRADSPGAVARVVVAALPILRATVRDSTATVALASVKEPVWKDGGTVVAISTRLAGVSAIILLIACANVANLFLAHGMQRRREVAVRLALGVSRKRLIWLLLGETLAVATIGGAAAIAVALWGGDALRRLLLPEVQWAQPAMGMRVAVFTAAIAVLAGMSAGLVPALRASRTDLTIALKAGAREGTYRRSRLQAALLAMQGALSVVLLAGAGLFIESLRHVEAVDIGYDADRLVLASIPRAGEGAGISQASRDEELSTRMPDIAGRIARLPGVEAVGLVEAQLMASIDIINTFLPDRDSVPKLNGLPPLASTVSPEFMGAAGMRIVAGRGFTNRDVVGSEPVIVVNAAMAANVWPGESAVGKCVIVGGRAQPCRTVIGVVSVGHLTQIIEQPHMHYYLPLAQWPSAAPNEIVIRVDPKRAVAVSAEARALLTAGLGSWARPTMTAMRDRLAPQLRPWRVGASLFGGAALLALLVAAVGVYSNIAYTITQRTHEMGVRVALGARSADILRLVVGEGVRVVAVGVVIGAAIALALGKLVASLLYATSPRDPAVLGATAIVLLLVAVAACVIPAWRATRADPMTALRVD